MSVLVLLLPTTKALLRQGHKHGTGCFWPRFITGLFPLWACVLWKLFTFSLLQFNYLYNESNSSYLHHSVAMKAKWYFKIIQININGKFSKIYKSYKIHSYQNVLTDQDLAGTGVLTDELLWLVFLWPPLPFLVVIIIRIWNLCLSLAA